MPEILKYVIARNMHAYFDNITITYITLLTTVIYYFIVIQFFTVFTVVTVPTEEPSLPGNDWKIYWIYVFIYVCVGWGVWRGGCRVGNILTLFLNLQ